MRLKKVVSFATLAAFVAGLSIGCVGSDVPVAKAPAPPPVTPQPHPKEARKGGGAASSSANMKRNPGADPLAPQ